MYWDVEGGRDETRVESVRTARANLAMALMAVEEWADAQRHLELALDSPGDSPPEWQLLTELGHVAERRGDPVAALEKFLEALVVTPRESSSQSAGHALRQLGRQRGSWLAQRADQDLYQRLLDRGSQVGNEAISKVAARLATLRGDLRKAGEIANENSEQVGDDSAWRTAMQASSVLSMLEEFRFEDALKALDAVQGEDESALGHLRALALYGQERDLEAIRVCADLPPNPDLCVVRAISYLALAASMVGQERAARLERARDAAALAARLDSGNPEPNLARAQVLLEGDLDLIEGRRLLKRAVKHLDAGVDTQHLLVWRLQSRRRTDELYAYFDVEFAHALGREDELISRVRAMSFSETSSRQDGAARQRLAGALVSKKDIAGAVEAYGLAADSFAVATDIKSARLCLEAQLRLEFSVPTALGLAERSWQSALAEPVRDTENYQADLRGGLAALRRVDAWLEDPRNGKAMSDSDIALANLLDGLLLYRSDQLTDGPAGMDLWRGCLSGMLAPELVPTEAYYAGHISSMLGDCSLHNAAYHFAARAYEMLPGDEWLQSRLIICRANWHGTLDDATTELLEHFSVNDPAWYAAINTWHQILSGNAAQMTSDLPDSDTNALWVQEIRAFGIMLRDGLEAARPHLEDLVRQATSERDYALAARSCLRIDLPRVDKMIGLAVQNHVITPRRAQVLHDFQSLVSSDGHEGRSGLEKWIRDSARPQRLLEILNVDIPTLRQAYDGRSGLTQALDGLAELVRARMPATVRPPLTSDIATGEAWCRDDRLREVIQALLASVDARAYGGDVLTPLRSAQALLGGRLQTLAVDRLLARSL